MAYANPTLVDFPTSSPLQPGLASVHSAWPACSIYTCASRVTRFYGSFLLAQKLWIPQPVLMMKIIPHTKKQALDLCFSKCGSWTTRVRKECLEVGMKLANMQLSSHLLNQKSGAGAQKPSFKSILWETLTYMNI